jgi:hypothetical protein
MRHPALFVLFYLALMAPTYFLPYLGSNSVLVGAALAAHEEAPAHWPLFLHATALFGLALIAWRRGFFINRRWLVIFPFLAGVFDMAPGLSLIPLVPTAMHLATIVLGVAVSSVAAESSDVAKSDATIRKAA